MRRLLGPILHVGFLFSRPLTMGVRAIVFDCKIRSVLMVKHTYSSGWYLPGGGIEPGESYATALKRELMEEVGISFENSTIIDVFHNSTMSTRDHVIITKLNYWEKKDGIKRPDGEIAEISWFRLNDLPKELSACTHFVL